MPVIPHFEAKCLIKLHDSWFILPYLGKCPQKKMKIDNTLISYNEFSRLISLN